MDDIKITVLYFLKVDTKQIMLSCAIVYAPHREVEQLTPYSIIYLDKRNRSSARQDIPDINNVITN